LGRHNVTLPPRCASLLPFPQRAGLYLLNQRKTPTVEGEDIAVVLIGDFNAKIFQSFWFAQEGLIRRSEAEEADVEIIHRDISVFRLEWCSLDVTRERFQAKTLSVAHRTALRDFVAGTFPKLCHTPTRQLGINFTQRLRFASGAEWHNYGHFLTPKSPWKGLLKQPGMRVVRLQGLREDGAEGYILVTVEPSNPGYVALNTTLLD
jgi:hypothetical protein